MDWLAQREVERLPQELLAHARLISTLAAEFELREVEGLLREVEADGLGAMFPLDASVGVRTLVQESLLTAHRADKLSFRLGLVREAINGSIPQDLKKRIHAAAFRFYQNHYHGPDGARLPHLARHAALSGRRAEGATLYLTLAERAQGRHAYLTAEQAYSRAITLLNEEQREDRTRAHKGRGVMRHRLSRYDDALKDLATATELAQALGAPLLLAQVLLDHATTLDWLGEYQGSKELVQRAAPLAEDLGSPPLSAAVVMGTARAYCASTTGPRRKSSLLTLRPWQSRWGTKDTRRWS
jgi:tetratricopeptide (TPR) repeat protein